MEVCDVASLGPGEMLDHCYQIFISSLNFEAHCHKLAAVKSTHTDV
jgi:hypothetical protein